MEAAKGLGYEPGVDEFGLPLIDDNLFADLTPLTESELGATFEQLTELAINQPDDTLAFEGLRRVVSEVHNRGEIAMAMQMAMVLGAMACLHPHNENLQTTANEVGEEVGGMDKNDRANAANLSSERNGRHNPQECSDCKAGRRCRAK